VGIGGVVTLPEARHQGCATTLMRHVTEFVEAEWSISAGLLFCLPRLVSYYQGLGWTVLDDAVEIEQPSGVRPSPMPVMVKPMRGSVWPSGPVQLDSRPW